MFIKLSDNAIFRKTAEHEGILINMVTREKVTVNETGFFSCHMLMTPCKTQKRLSQSYLSRYQMLVLTSLGMTLWNS